MPQNIGNKGENNKDLNVLMNLYANKKIGLCW